jgi:HEAT repeat protein
MAVEPAELSTICPSILDQAFTDRALVVRAEAVSTLGQIHDGSGDAGISKKLLEATTDPRNRRKNTPVMVQRRALYAIKKIGHPEYVKAAAAAAAKDPALNEYWQKLELARSGASKP